MEKQHNFLPSKEAMDAFFLKHYPVKDRLSPKEKINAVLRYSVWSGKIKKPKTCSKCGITGKRICEHHHMGYEKEHALDVVWLCDRCHSVEHLRY
jgi:ribosomal protein S27AE